MKNTVSLNQNTLFRRAYYRGKPYHNGLFVLYVMPNGSKVNRLGFTVSKKIGKAVVRNRTRRLLYEGFRLYEPQIKTGYIIVIVAKTGMLEADFHQVRSMLGIMLKKAGLIN